MATFLLEIGSEELPSRFLASEEKELAGLFGDALDDAGLDFATIRTMATPRRLALFVEGLATEQKKKEELVLGPPVKAAYAADGSPTKALEGFARSNEAPLSAIFRHKTDKGEYVALRKTVGGGNAADILPSICARVIPALSFPKRMRWGSREMPYARPLRWLVALLDSRPLHINIDGLESADMTWGHRVMGPGPFRVSSPGHYLDVLESDCKITLDPAARKKAIVEKGNALAREKGGEIIWKDSLLDEVSGLVEHPVPLLGDFDPSYLEIPAEVLLTSMETHQKSFGVKGPDGRLLPHFLTVLNLEPEDMAVVKRGWERVLRARLEDARFFWRADRADNFDNWLKKLDHVIFIGPLGSMGEKSRRLEKLCLWLAGWTEPGKVDPALAARAGLLAKADLVSGMVGEFDTLQGIMGGIYAREAGENPEVADAIGEQYLPAGPDSPLPRTILGGLLSMADKADTLAGCFGLGMLPTAMADPNGLRRCALGIIRILLDRRYDFKVSDLFAKARELYGDKKWKLSAEEAGEKLLDFYRGRLRNYFLSLGYDTLAVDAALAAGIERAPDCKDRLDALTAFGKSPEFANSTQVLKRVENILKKAALDQGDAAWQDELLEEEAEKSLSARLKEILPAMDAKMAKGDYAGALDELTALRAPVSDFFDQVMVLCEDEKLRLNRLRMLNSLRERFARIGQFSLLQI